MGACLSRTVLTWSLFLALLTTSCFLSRVRGRLAKLLTVLIVARSSRSTLGTSSLSMMAAIAHT